MTRFHDRPCRLDPEQLDADIRQQVNTALAEDIGTGDITAQLIPADRQASAHILTRQDGVLCGQRWVEQVFRTLDPQVQLHWQVQDGQTMAADTVLLELSGNARTLLTGERSAMNFLQTLSAVATATAHHVQAITGLTTKLLDTRKTLPGLRSAEKYAVTCGGGHNHRIGLYDAFLIKENHIAASGSISAAVARAQQIAPGKPVEVEVENFSELDEAIAAGSDIIMLDNFSIDDMKRAVQHTGGRVALEASGGIGLHNLRAVAETGVDYISLGTLTKDISAIDLSMRLR